MKRCLPIFLFFIAINAHAAVHAWKDSQGNMQYSDEPPPADVKAHILHTPKPAEDAPVQKSYIEREAERKKKLMTKEKEGEKAAEQQKNEQIKQKNCQAAKSNLLTLESNLRVATFNEKGEQVIMDDTARQQGIEDARRLINESCN